MRTRHQLPGYLESFDLADPNPEAALARAKEKMRAIRAGETRLDAPGWFVGRVVKLVVFGLGPAIAAFWFAWHFYRDGARVRETGELVLAAFLSCVGLLAVAATIPRLVGARPSSPKRALGLYYKFLGRGRFRAAERLVVPSDLDGFPRWDPEPHPTDLHPSSPDPYHFSNPVFFDAYWSSILRRPTMPYCLTRIRRLKTTEIAPGVVLCDFELRLTINTSLWALLILVALIVALIVDLATRKNYTVPVRKILVRTEGDQWVLFNGEWEGHEELDPSWVRA